MTTTSSVPTLSRLTTAAFDVRTHAHRRLPPIALNAASRAPTSTDGLPSAQREQPAMDPCAVAVMKLFEYHLLVSNTSRILLDLIEAVLGSFVHVFDRLGCPTHTVTRLARSFDSTLTYVVRAHSFARTIHLINTVVLFHLRLVDALKPR